MGERHTLPLVFFLIRKREKDGGKEGGEHTTHIASFITYSIIEAFGEQPACAASSAPTAPDVPVGGSRFDTERTSNHQKQDGLVVEGGRLS
jgi:hypothetical protein